MTVDEYETIRLIDLDGLTQEECAAQMNISRTTVQGIYYEARQKLAQALVHGKVLRIEGGEYRLCDARGPSCGGGGCCQRGCGLDYGEDWEDSAVVIASDPAGVDEQRDTGN